MPLSRRLRRQSFLAHPDSSYRQNRGYAKSYCTQSLAAKTENSARYHHAHFRHRSTQIFG